MGTLVGANPPAAPERSIVRVAGEGMAGFAGRDVSLTWDMNGAVLATAPVDDEGRFVADVTVPETEPGVYYLSAVGDGAGVARTAFEVTAPGGASSDGPVPVAPSSDLRPSASSAALPSGNSGLMAGAGILGAGLMAVASGFTVVAVRRRRSVAVRR